MNHLSIFAGVDATGELRFVGDVPRGAACGCRCVACGAALVARRGDVRHWHFAHEASQERPDCYAGAVNLLRRLAVEHLRAQGAPTLPTYRVQVATRAPLPHRMDVLTYEPGTAAFESWEEDPSSLGSVALLRLATGTGVRVFVTINAELQVKSSDIGEGEGAVQFEVPLPFDRIELQDRQSAVRHIDEAGQWVWLGCPDADPQKARILADLEASARAAEAASALSRAKGSARVVNPAWSTVPSWPTAPAQPAIDDSPWAAWRKPRHAFICYGMKDGTGWVIITHKDGRLVMAPHPEVDGWDESIPASIGVPDAHLSALVLADRVAAMVFLGPRASMIRTATSWQELLSLPWPPAPSR